MTILAFDIASRTGWAATTNGDDGPGIAWGHFAIELGGEEGIGRGLSHFCRNLERIIVTFPGVDVLAWEKPIQASKHSAVYDEFVKGAIGLLRMTAFDRNWQTLACDMKAVRRHFIGDGVLHDAKAQVFQRCKVLGYAVKNDDESDAIATLHYAIGTMKVRAYARSSQSFGGKGGRAFAAPRRAGGHRRL